MWPLLTPGFSRLTVDGIGQSPPPLAAQYQTTVKARDDLAATQAGGETKLAEASTLQGLRQDLATLSQGKQDPRLEQAGKLLSPSNPDLASRKQALELLSAVAQERVAELDAAVRLLADPPQFIHIQPDLTVLQPMPEVPEPPLTLPAPHPRPEFIHVAADPAPPLVPMVVVDPSIDVLSKPR